MSTTPKIKPVEESPAETMLADPRNVVSVSRVGKDYRAVIFVSGLKTQAFGSSISDAIENLRKEYITFYKK